jgi:hypothetical protein
MNAELDYDKIENIKLAGIDHRDYPDFCDAYIVSADYDGEEMTSQQLGEINNNRDFVYDEIIKQLF